MANRFKSVKFSKFQNGEIQKKFSEIGEMAYSNKIAINDDNKVLLAKIFESNEIAESYPYATAEKIGGQYGATDYFYFFLSTTITGSEHAVLYKAYRGDAPTLVKDFGVGLPEQIILHRNRIIVQFESDATGDLEWWQATSPTGTWTEIVEMKNILIYDWAILDDIIYISTIADTWGGGKSDIYKSTDEGVSFSLFISDAPVRNLYSANGFIYGKYGDLHILENGEFRVVQKNVQGTVFSFDDNLYSIDYHHIYGFNGDKFFVKRTFEETEYISFLGVSPTKLYFSLWEDAGSSLSNYYIYSYDNRGILLREFEILGKDEDWQLFFLYYAGDTTYIMTLDYDELTTQIWHDYNQKYSTSGDFQTTIVDEGEIVPKQLILRHKPLETGASVKVYAKKDRASSWGSALITSNTVGGVKKKYTFPSGTIQDFAEFKVELITTDVTKTPDDIQLEFLYLPIGLENSK